MDLRTASCLILVGACSGAPPGASERTRRYAAALAAVEDAPRSAAAQCGALAPDALRADCLLAGAEALAAEDPDAAAALCGQVGGGAARDECHFQVAERSGEVSRCIDAGRFAEDCRMHGWTRLVMRTVPPGTGSAEAVAALEPLARDAGFPADDPRPWIAAFRHLHGGDRPLGTSRCAGLGGVEASACRDAAEMLLHDRMSYLRDTGAWPCEAPTPAIVELENDPRLQATRRERRAEVCP